MRCEEVRPLLVELAERPAPPAGQVRAHLAGCSSCSAELQRYRAVLVELAALRDVLIEPSGGFLGRVLAQMPEPARRRFVDRLVRDERLHRAAFSLGGVIVAATAIALVWRRASRRGLAAAGETG